MSLSNLSSVPLLNGANYPSWSSSMTALLRASRCWSVTSGRIPRPKPTFRKASTSEVAAGTYKANEDVETTTAERQKEIEDWDSLDDQAMGLIALRLPDDIRATVLKTESGETWDEIKKIYGKPGSAGTFGIFKEAINFQIDGRNDPTLALASLNSTFSRLDGSGLTLPEPVKAMILLAALPTQWDSLAMTILSRDATLLTPSNIMPIIQDEYRRRQSNATSLAARISGVKRQSDSKSSWNDQKKKKDTKKGAPYPASKPSNDSSSSSDKDKKTRRGKKGGKGKEKAHESAEVETSNVSNFATCLASRINDSFLREASHDSILDRMKIEEVEVDLSDHLWPQTKLEMDIDKEMYGSGNERLIFWQASLNSLKEKFTDQLHSLQQMFNNMAGISNGPNGPYVSHSPRFLNSVPPSEGKLNKMVSNDVHGANKNLSQIFNTWLLDSGASGYFTPYRQDFVSYKKFTHPIPVQTADERTSTFIEGAGTVYIRHDNGEGKILTTKLHPVFYQPHCTHRLLSVGLLNRQGCYTTINVEKSVIRKTDDDSIIMTLYPNNDRDNIHWLKADVVKSEIGMISSPNDFNTWHNRFAHPGDVVLRNAPGNVNGLPKLSIPDKESPCKGCALGKAASKAYPKSEKRASNPMDLIHADLVEIPTVSYHKFKFVITLLDDCSSHATSIMLRQKSEAFQAFKDFNS